MKYGELIRRSWDIVQDNLSLIMMSYLIALLAIPTLVSRLLPIDGLIIATIQIFFSSIQMVLVGVITAAINQIEAEGILDFAEAWRAVSEKILTLAAIGLPMNVFLSMSLYGLSSLFSQDLTFDTTGLVLACTCGGVIVMLVLGMLSQFAYPACVLEHTGVIGSYDRGWEVLTQNLGEVIVLYLIFAGAGLVMGLVIGAPIICLASTAERQGALCVPLFELAIAGPLGALTYTLWTLAYREWAGIGSPEAPPSKVLSGQRR